MQLPLPLLFAFVHPPDNSDDNDDDIEYPYNYVRYQWTLPLLANNLSIDASQIADYLLELGAISATVVPCTPIDISEDDHFAKTGRITTLIGYDDETSATMDCTMIEFGLLDYGENTAIDMDLQAEALGREALATVFGSDTNDAAVAKFDFAGSIERINSDDTSSGNIDGSYCLEESSNEQNLTINGIQLSILSHLVVENGHKSSVYAFGDGLHPSTALAIRGLGHFADQWQGKQPFSLLDYGSGTGILTVVGLALGAKRVVAVDISDDALTLARENLRKNNHVVNSDAVQVVKYLGEGNEPDDVGAWESSFDAVVANIPSNTLISLLPTLAKAASIQKGASIMTCGYPSFELEQVSHAAKTCSLQEDTTRRCYNSGWVLQVFEHEQRKIVRPI